MELELLKGSREERVAPRSKPPLSVKGSREHGAGQLHDSPMQNQEQAVTAFGSETVLCKPPGCKDDVKERSSYATVALQS